MKRSDLKSFDVVQLRNGERYIFVKMGIEVLFNKKDTSSLLFYNENLTHYNVKSKDVVAVYRTTNDLTTSRMIWEREEKIELTQTEKEILKHILNNGYFFMARDRDDGLYLFKSEPFKFDDSFWISDNDYYEELPNFLSDLFQFVKWEQEEAMSIKELLKK